MAEILALVAAFFFALAATLQQKGALGMGEVSLGSPRSLLSLARQTWWLLGTVALLGGYAFQAVALANGRRTAGEREVETNAYQQRYCARSDVANRRRY